VSPVEFLKSVGQKPLLLKFYVNGYVINRLQAAVMREAIHLVESGVADVDAVDTTMRDGLGLRWALLGSFGVNNCNADDGVREYYPRFGNLYKSLMKDLSSDVPSFGHEMIERIAQGVDAMEGNAPRSEICRWRDRLVVKIRELKEKEPHP
jgi:3-hydroxyacyl-CoA dehydrogenase